MIIELNEIMRDNKEMHQVTVSQVNQAGGIDREHIEASANVNRAISRAMPTINQKIRVALLAGKSVEINIK